MRVDQDPGNKLPDKLFLNEEEQGEDGDKGISSRRETKRLRKREERIRIAEEEREELHSRIPLRFP
jgi:hypothetical protein